MRSYPPSGSAPTFRGHNPPGYPNPPPYLFNLKAPTPQRTTGEIAQNMAKNNLLEKHRIHARLDYVQHEHTAKMILGCIYSLYRMALNEEGCPHLTEADNFIPSFAGSLYTHEITKILPAVRVMHEVAACKCKIKPGKEFYPLSQACRKS